MKVSDIVLKKILTRAGILDEDQVTSVFEDAKEANKTPIDVLYEKSITDEVSLTKAYANYAGVTFIELNPKDLDKEVLNIIPERIARQYNVIPFSLEDSGCIHLAMDDPDDIQAITVLKKQMGHNVNIYIATTSNILDCLDLYRGDVDEELQSVISVQKEEVKEEQAKESEVTEDSPIAQTVNLVLEYAIRSSASDIHIEPREDYIQVRYRIDGNLKEVNRIPKHVLNALVSRIKILSNLKIDERRVPQDGRFKILLSGRKFAFRVSTLPIADGEKIVMRILNESSNSLTLKQLGYWGHSLKIINDAITQPNGMILVTGPTGSGKSTSLFSILSKLNTPDVNISTIEDPVEYKIPGVNQTQTNAKAGMTFASGLRALLRQDPNIIMVGEIRDGETANLGVQAALTGHLVFSTLHTNNAATCLPRLLDMNIEPFLIASTVQAVVGQRLVRRICMHCREQYTPDEDTVKGIVEMFKLGEKDFTHIRDLELQAIEQEVGGDTPQSTNDHTIQTLWKAHSKGCNECNYTGFKGRVGVYEVLGNSTKIQHLITSNATSDQIQDQSVEEGMTTMLTDGLIKAIRGNTTVEEVLRVTRD